MRIIPKMWVTGLLQWHTNFETTCRRPPGLSTASLLKAPLFNGSKRLVQASCKPRANVGKSLEIPMSHGRFAKD